MDEVNGLDRKVVILGCTDVGKTSLTMRYCHNSFAHPTSATIGASFLQKRILIQGQKMTLQIWDTAGQERFRSMAPMYYRNAKAAILVYDITQEHTFEKMKGWLQDLQKHVEKDIVLAVVGNKSDADGNFDLEDANAFAKSIGASSHCTSAKDGTGVEELFNEVSQKLLSNHNKAEEEKKQKNKKSQNRSHIDRNSPSNDTFVLNEASTASGKSSGCCDR